MYYQVTDLLKWVAIDRAQKLDEREILPCKVTDLVLFSIQKRQCGEHLESNCKETVYFIMFIC